MSKSEGESPRRGTVGSELRAFAILTDTAELTFKRMASIHASDLSFLMTAITSIRDSFIPETLTEPINPKNCAILYSSRIQKSLLPVKFCFLNNNFVEVALTHSRKGLCRHRMSH